MDGVPVRWLQVEGPLRGTLVLLTGTADEPFPRRGWTHLIEHLVLAPLGHPPHEFGGTVDLFTTRFTLSGTPEEVGAGLTVIAKGLDELPVERLEEERRILAVEANGRRRGIHDHLLYRRFGPLGPGVSGEPEWGRPGATGEGLTAWSRARLHRGSAVLILTGPIPPDLRLPLPDAPEGHVSTLGEPTPVLPPGRSCIGGDSSLVALAGLVTPGVASRVLHGVLRQRMLAELRHERALTYSPDVVATRVGKRSEHVIALADCQPAEQQAVAQALVAVLEALTEQGPTPDELQRERTRWRNALLEPTAPLAALEAEARRCLMGTDEPALGELYSLVEGVTPQDVAGAAGAFLESGLLALADTDGAPPGWPALPEWSRCLPQGEVLYREDSQTSRSRLVVTDKGVGIHSGPDQFVTVNWDDVAGVAVWDDGARYVEGRDGTGVRRHPEPMARGRSTSWAAG